MTVTGRLDLIVIDARDIEKLAEFYAGLAGWEIIHQNQNAAKIPRGLSSRP